MQETPSENKTGIFQSKKAIVFILSLVQLNVILVAGAIWPEIKTDEFVSLLTFLATAYLAGQSGVDVTKAVTEAKGEKQTPIESLKE